MKKTRAVSIMYHDVVEAGQWESSGFRGRDADAYKLERSEFEKHLNSIQAAVPDKSVSTVDCLEHATRRAPVFLTFDDGGASAHTLVAASLEKHGWRGHFFITTSLIGTSGFLSEAQIRDLHKRGHRIGSHSCSHPTRMSYCRVEQLEQEWTVSVRRLSEIVGEQVTLASVPGGYYSRLVGECAAAAGIRVLFTSEPTTSIHSLDGCAILGRYFIQRGMRPEISGGFAAMRLRPRLEQAAVWKLKKVAKAIAGGPYLKLRERFFSAR